MRHLIFVFGLALLACGGNAPGPADDGSTDSDETDADTTDTDESDTDESDTDASDDDETDTDAGDNDPTDDDGDTDVVCDCAPYTNAEAVCGRDGQCSLGACDVGFADCNHNGSDGCEHALADGACLCVPGASVSCYEGAEGTVGVGPCSAGTQTCEATGLAFGPCNGQVLPTPEGCELNSDDSDCNGTYDDGLVDFDGDGWSTCDGDCCDTLELCATPLEVNPGAYDFANGVNDDCRADIDDATLTCDTDIVSDSSSGVDYAHALELCSTTTQSPAAAERVWGVISASLALSNGSGTPAPASHAIRPSFGTNIAPVGARLAILSTGHAAAPDQTLPPFVEFQNGANLGTTSAFPADWLAANGGTLPSAPGCPAASTQNPTNDPVMLTLRIRVPTNARSFSLGAFLLSSEFPEWVCDSLNDIFVALLDSAFVAGSGEIDNPSDKNIAVYTSPSSGRYPLGINLARDSTGLFQACVNGDTGCASGNAGTITTCLSASPLLGTGFDTAVPEDACNGSGDRVGGGTGWLRLSGNVVPGEIITLRLAIWDTGDHLYDSLILLDDFQWSPSVTTPGVSAN